MSDISWTHTLSFAYNYINDMCRLSLPYKKTFTYEDDTAPIFCGNSWPEDFLHAQKGFNILLRCLRRMF